MFTFQSIYRSFDLNVGSKVIQFHNFVFNTSDTALAEKLRRHAEHNPKDVWELVAPTKDEPEAEVQTGPKRRGRPPKGVQTFRGTRTSEVQEQKE